MRVSQMISILNNQTLSSKFGVNGAFPIDLTFDAFYNRCCLNMSHVSYQQQCAHVFFISSVLHFIYFAFDIYDKCLQNISTCFRDTFNWRRHNSNSKVIPFLRPILKQ